MKKIAQTLCIAAVAIAMAACGGNKQYTITGSVADDQFDGAMVYLYNNGEVVDSANISNGHFTLRGTVERPWVGMVYTHSESARAMLDFIVEPGQIELDLLDDHVGGTPLNDSLQLFLTANDNSDLDAQLKGYLQLYYTAPSAEVRAQAEHLYDSVEAIGTDRTFALANKMYDGNRDNVLGAYALGVLCGTDRLTYAMLEEKLADAAQVVKDYKPVADKLAQLRAIEQTSVGKHYTDIEGVDGRLSDIVEGHVALVDFYASWCGPCRAEIRDNIVPLWAKYKDKGLVVVGLNVWERGDAAARKAAHEKVMADLGITYPQLVDSTRTATDTYGVQSIPQIMLIGADGTILARDLRGAAIEEAIVNALGK